MKKMYSKMFLKRFVIYPAIIGYITLVLFDWMIVSEFGKMFLDTGPIAIIEQTFGISLPFEKVKLYYAYSIGFAYGTMSAILPIHKLRLGVIGLVMMYIKYVLTVFVLAPVAMAWIPIEIIVTATLLLMSKVFKNSSVNKQPKKRMKHREPVHV